MKTVLGLILAVALFPAFSLASAAVDGPFGMPQNWTAPPYWMRPAAKSPTATPGTGRGSRTALVTATPLPFVGIDPCRQYDSRAATPLLQDTPRTVTLTGAPCGIPAAAQAVALNITVFNITGAGANGVFSVGTSPPATAWINYPPTETQRGNAGVVAVTGAGEIIVQVEQGGGSVAFVVDVFGYYAPQGIVNTLNTLSGDVTLSAGTNVSITPSGQTLTIAAAGGGGGPPSGSAGGSLSGTYPNPGIASGAVGATQLANSTAVRSINGAAQDMVTLQGSGAVSVSTLGSTITIAAPSGSMVLGAPGDTTLIGAGYTEIASTSIEYWTATATTGAPLARYLHTAVWTGSRMIVWGGLGVSFLNDGGQYDPVTNAWTATASTSAPSARHNHTAVWTGSRMIVWGGIDPFNAGAYLNDGGQYDPVANAWMATSATDAPLGRILHTAIWTGSRMIAWGGSSGTFDSLDDGGQYDPVANAWMATAPVGVPAARYSHTAVWTGLKMIVWGGRGDAGLYLNDGGQYDPAANTWTLTTTTGAPSARASHTAVWTGSRMIVWGGGAYLGLYLNDGGQYDPIANTWKATTTANAPSGRQTHTAVWSGSRMIVWGGYGGGGLNDGAQYDPVVDTWIATTTTGAPSARAHHTAVWTGSRMIVWGGELGVELGGTILNDGGQVATASLFRKN